MHPIPRVHQPIHQEVPVVRGLDDHARQLVAMRFQYRPNLPQIVRQTFLIHDSIFLITHHDYTVVRVQVNSAKLHVGLLRVKAGSHLNFSPAASTRRGGPLHDYHSMALSTRSRLWDFLIDWLVYPVTCHSPSSARKSEIGDKRSSPEIAGDVSSNEGHRQLSKVRQGAVSPKRTFRLCMPAIGRINRFAIAESTLPYASSVKTGMPTDRIPQDLEV